MTIPKFLIESVAFSRTSRCLVSAITSRSRNYSQKGCRQSPRRDRHVVHSSLDETATAIDRIRRVDAKLNSLSGPRVEARRACSPLAGDIVRVRGTRPDGLHGAVLTDDTHAEKVRRIGGGVVRQVQAKRQRERAAGRQRDRRRINRRLAAVHVVCSVRCAGGEGGDQAIRGTLAVAKLQR